MPSLSRSFLLVAPLVSLSLAAPFYGRVIGRDANISTSYDYVIVGGGVSGLVVANRLSEDSAVTVLVVEAGELDAGEDFIAIPGISSGLGQNAVGTKYDWNVSYSAQSELNNRSVQMPIGKVVGGGSILNRMLMDRGSKADYDRWAELGNVGWDFAGLLPYFIKSETFTPPAADFAAEWGIEHDASVHGTSGYVNSSYPPFVYPSTKNYFESMKSLGINVPKDAANGEALGAFWSTLALNPGVSTRCSARVAYHDTVETRSNLHLLTGNQVTKLVTDSTSGSVTATGIEYASDASSAIKSVTANKEVILAAGSLHTPQVLQLSGIGSASFLSSLGISSVIDLPGVGENHQDHQYVAIANTINTTEVSFNALSANATLAAEALAVYKANGTGPYSTSGSISLAFLPLGNYSNATSTITSSAGAQGASTYLANDTDATVAAGYKAQYDILVRDMDSFNIANMEFIYSDGTVVLALQHPLSRGSVKIASTDPFATPIYDSRWLSNPADLAQIVEAFKFGRKITTTSAFTSLSPVEAFPGSAVTTDAQIETYIRENLATLFHPACSAAMMPKEMGGVVDSNLLVYGTSNLRIVDASIFPMLPATHIMSTVYAVAEKAADIIRGAATC
ncbi:hypothetical protein BP6252_04827 [Coleophoma cylindrospora]|uniref:Glucose-methanol-choline oxidoreductase N-terminal domain-containing protein n=1 Tax=Coleophoma cylindrospora TaxID=1849047 RepID=A0A3D8S1L9_9HELO|nr:hypothetical protein BP6252_04827 [Coleophoma cylindrospora]